MALFSFFRGGSGRKQVDNKSVTLIPKNNDMSIPKKVPEDFISLAQACKEKRETIHAKLPGGKTLFSKIAVKIATASIMSDIKAGHVKTDLDKSEIEEHIREQLNKK